MTCARSHSQGAQSINCTGSVLTQILTSIQTLPFPIQGRHGREKAAKLGEEKVVQQAEDVLCVEKLSLYETLGRQWKGKGEKQQDVAEDARCLRPKYFPFSFYYNCDFIDKISHFLLPLHVGVAKKR